MTLPNNKDKYDSDSIITPEGYVAYAKSRGRYNFSCPKRIILTYSRKLHQYVKETYSHTNPEFSGDLLILNEFDVGVIGNFGIGGPITSVIVEELGGLGASEFIIVGTAGCIAKEPKIGDVILVDKAIRDEGVSHHYLPPEKFAYASEKLVSKFHDVISDQGIEFHQGPSWTIDAPYRETKAEVLQYQEEGILTVEMEAASVYSISKFRSFRALAILSVSDDLSDLKWDPQFHTSELRDKLRVIIDLAIQN